MRPVRWLLAALFLALAASSGLRAARSAPLPAISLSSDASVPVWGHSGEAATVTPAGPESPERLLAVEVPGGATVAFRPVIHDSARPVPARVAVVRGSSRGRAPPRG